MALMDSLLNAAMSAIGNQNGDGGRQNAALGMLMELVQQSGGIGNLMAKLQQGGLGDALNSWISTQSSNQSVSGSDLQQALGGIAGVNEVRGQGLIIGVELDRPCGALLGRAACEGLIAGGVRPQAWSFLRDSRRPAPAPTPATAKE
mgnify:CR=1 FL=1